MRLGVVATGGTIAGALTSDIVQAVDRSKADALSWVQTATETGDLTIFVRGPIQVMSENMAPTDWVTIGSAVRDLIVTEGVDGVLVLHGTDTAAFATSAIAFLCDDLPIPIALTGSNIPLESPGSDALNNIAGAVKALIDLAPGSYLSFCGSPVGVSEVFLGTHVRKLHAGGQPYRSVTGMPYGSIAESGDFVTSAAAQSTGQRALPRCDDIEPGAVMLPLYPGFDFDIVRSGLRQHPCHTVVMQLYGSLSAPVMSEPSRHSTLAFIEWCARRNIAVVGAPHEPPHMSLPDYESTVDLREAGMLITPTLIPESAYVKACWVAAAASDTATRRRLMEAPSRTEAHAIALLSKVLLKT